MNYDNENIIRTGFMYIWIDMHFGWCVSPSYSPRHHKEFRDKGNIRYGSEARHCLSSCRQIQQSAYIDSYLNFSFKFTTKHGKAHIAYIMVAGGERKNVNS